MNTLRWLLLGSLLGFSMSLVSCGAAGKCNPSNCAFGCCDASGTCQGGVSDSQCGGQGRTCMACGLGLQCQIGQCMAIGTGQGGGTSGGGTGGGTTGGGTGGGTTGGGTGGGTTGGGTGGGTTGGGTGGGTTGGGTGGGTTGGGTGGGTTGGGGGTNTTCTSLATSFSTFLAGRQSCGSLTLDPNFSTRCPTAITSCTAGDQTILTGFGACISSVPCTTGNEGPAQSQFNSCATDTASLSGPCSQAIFGSGTGGGGGTTGGGGGTTGGGGGTTGGGGGTTGGGTGCTPLSLSAQRSAARYLSGSSLEYTFASGFSAANDPTDIVGMEVIWAADLGSGLMDLATTVPATNVNLATGGTYFDCTYCATLRRGCTFNTTSMAYDCTGGNYLARMGSVSVSSAPRMASGSFSGSLSNVTFQEWNLQMDTPVTNGRCFTLPSFSLTNVTVQ